MAFVPSRLMMLPLPADVLAIIWIREMCARFLDGVQRRRRAAMHIQRMWDLHVEESLPDLVAIDDDAPWAHWPVQLAHWPVFAHVFVLGNIDELIEVD